jgi:hypothetical protein
VTTTGFAESINCVRGSALPNQTQYNTAVGNNWGGLHVVRAATDDLAVAALVTGTTSVPVGLSRNQLSFIYSAATQPVWSSIPGGYTPPNPGAPVGSVGNCPSCPITALLPQSGSGTRNTFVADLQAAGCPCTAFAGWINQSSEENDPVALTSSVDPANTIIPFSGDRLKLWQSGYFHNPHVGYTNTPAPPGGGALSPGVTLLGGPPNDGVNPVYNDNRGLYYTYRVVDDSTVDALAPAGQQGWQPGTPLNWANALFAPGSFLATSFKAKNPVQAAGGTYAYLDCGTGGPAAWDTAGCKNTVQ